MQPLIALQLEDSRVERQIEREHISAPQKLDLGICPRSPLSGGFPTGKYRREGNSRRGVGRLEKTRGSANPVFQSFTELNWRVPDALLEVARQIQRPAAQLALNWVAAQPGITSTIIARTSARHLNDNLASLEFAHPPNLRKRLDEASALNPVHPHLFFGGQTRTMIAGGVALRPWTLASVTGGPGSKVAPSEKLSARHNSFSGQRVSEPEGG